MMKSNDKKKETKIRVDASAGGYLVNRWLAYTWQRKYNNHGTIEENSEILWEKRGYRIQWTNIKRDLKAFFKNPFGYAPTVAYSLLAIPLIFFDHDKAVNFAFFGSIAFDAAAQTSHSGEPTTITWEHTIGSNDDRLININVSGLSTPNEPQWDGNSTTNIISVSAMHNNYYLAPASGAADCTCDGGNIKVGGSISFDGVHQTDPIGASTSNGTPSSPQDVSLTTEDDNSFRVDCIEGHNGDSTNPSASLDSGDERHNDIVSQNQFRCMLFGYTNFQATAGSDTHQWTYDIDASDDLSAFEIKEATAGAAGIRSLRQVIGHGQGTRA